MTRPVEANAELRKWQLSTDQTKLLGLIYNDKTGTYLDGDMYKSIMVKRVVNYPDFYLIYTVGYIFECRKEHQLKPIASETTDEHTTSKSEKERPKD